MNAVLRYISVFLRLLKTNFDVYVRNAQKKTKQKKKQSVFNKTSNKIPQLTKIH